MLGRRRRGRDETPEPEQTYRELRAMALAAVPNGLPAPLADHPRVSGVVVDIPSNGAHATVVALTDDTTSMYTSTGGGTIGAGAHARVAAATQALLVAIDQHLDGFRGAEDHALPPAGRVRSHVLTPSGGRTADVSDESFWGRAEDPLMAVIAATQDVISAIRSVSPE